MPPGKEVTYSQQIELIEKQQKLQRSYLEEKKKAQSRKRVKTPRCIFCGAAIGMEFTVDPDDGHQRIRCGGDATVRGESCGYEFDLKPPTLVTPLMDSADLKDTTNEIIERLYFLQKRAIIEGVEIGAEDEQEWGELVEELKNVAAVAERQDAVIEGVRKTDEQMDARRQIQQEIFRMIQKRSAANADEEKRREQVRQLIESKKRIRELGEVVPEHREIIEEDVQRLQNGVPIGEAEQFTTQLRVSSVALSHVVLDQGAVFGDLEKEV